MQEIDLTKVSKKSHSEFFIKMIRIKLYYSITFMFIGLASLIWIDTIFLSVLWGIWMGIILSFFSDIVIYLSYHYNILKSLGAYSWAKWFLDVVLGCLFFSLIIFVFNSGGEQVGQYSELLQPINAFAFIFTYIALIHWFLFIKKTD